MNVQALINNISFPKTLDELKYFALERGCYDIEDILYNNVVEWTMPKWATIGDIVFSIMRKQHYKQYDV